MPDQFPKKITDITTIPFSVDKFGLYNIAITARCQSSKQDLRVEIDSLKFREIPPKDKPRYNNIPPSWNGTELKGLSKTIIFILRLNKGAHKLIFIPTEEAIIDEYKIESISDPQNMQFNPEIQAEDGDRRPWLIFTLVDLPLKSIIADISTKWHFLDGDDVKLIIDNIIKKNSNSILHKNWVWSSSLFNIFSKERQEKTFLENLQSDIHYIEFWADKTPTIHKVKIELGDIDLKRIPTVDDPEWTGNFNDDMEEMLLARLVFGEARSQSDEAMKGVAWVVKNRLLSGRSDWGNTYHSVILAPYQFAAMNPEDDNFLILIDPLNTQSQITKDAWRRVYKVSQEVIKGSVDDSTGGALFFHSSDYPQKKFVTEDVPGAIFTKQINDMLFYKK